MQMPGMWRPEDRASLAASGGGDGPVRGAFCRSGLPQVVKEAALFNLSTLRTQTCFRTADGRFFAWEGCGDNAGCCWGSCTHVWNYEQATAFLFGSLARSMRETEFASRPTASGLMSFRVRLAAWMSSRGGRPRRTDRWARS